MTDVPDGGVTAHALAPVGAAISDEEIMAYGDGALPPERRAAVRDALAQDPALMERLESFLVTRGPLAAPFDEVLAAPIPDKLLRALQEPATTSVPRRGLFAILRAAMRGPPSASFRMPLLAVAAICAIFLGGWVVKQALRYAPSDRYELVILDERGLIAVPSLQRVLDEVPSGEPAALSAQLSIKPRSTFRSANGTWCRDFNLIYSIGLKGLGLACRRSDGAWRVLVTTVPPGEDYNVAGGKQASKTRESSPADAGNEALDGVLRSISPKNVATPEKEKSLIAGQWRD